jgi:hypothetical protein
MNGSNLFAGRKINNAVYIQVSLDRPLALADQVSFVRFEAVQAKAVFLRVNGDGSESQLGGRTENSRRDLATI